jgi:hypothetical protein
MPAVPDQLRRLHCHARHHRRSAYAHAPAGSAAFTDRKIHVKHEVGPSKEVDKVPSLSTSVADRYQEVGDLGGRTVVVPALVLCMRQQVQPYVRSGLRWAISRLTSL